MNGKGIMCKQCRLRGKAWEGNDPKCGFVFGVFNVENWNCATLNNLRDIAASLNSIQYLDDCSIATIPVKDEGWIVLAWYKQRGRTSTARFIIDDTDELLRIETAEQAIEEYKSCSPHAQG